MNKRAKVSLASGVLFSTFLERNNPAIPSQWHRQFADSSKVFKQKIKKASRDAHRKCMQICLSNY